MYMYLCYKLHCVIHLWDRADLIIPGINFTEQSRNNKVLRILINNTQIFSSKVKKRSLVDDFPEVKVV